MTVSVMVRGDSGSMTDRVRLIMHPCSVVAELRPYRDRIGIVAGHVDDEVLVRFGEVVVQVPAELLEPVE